MRTGFILAPAPSMSRTASSAIATTLVTGRSAALMIGLLVGSAAATIGACGGESACQQRVTAMRRSFEAIPAKASAPLVIVEPSFPLPASSGGELLRSRGPVVRIGPDGGVGLDGSSARDRNAIVLAVIDQLTAPDQDRALYLAIAPGALLTPHFGLLAELGEQAPLRVLTRDVADASRTPPTPSPAVAARLAELADADPSRKAMGMADALKTAIGTCEPLHAAFEGLATLAPDRRQGELVNAALSGAESCGCEVVDVDGLHALVWQLLMGDGPPQRWLPLLPGPAGAPLPATATGADLARQLATGPAIALPL